MAATKIKERIKRQQLRTLRTHSRFSLCIYPGLSWLSCWEPSKCKSYGNNKHNY